MYFLKYYGLIQKWWACLSFCRLLRVPMLIHLIWAFSLNNFHRTVQDLQSCWVFLALSWTWRLWFSPRFLKILVSCTFFIRPMPESFNSVNLSCGFLHFTLFTVSGCLFHKLNAGLCDLIGQITIILFHKKLILDLQASLTSFILDCNKI